jgi:hypothetical protein
VVGTIYNYNLDSSAMRRLYEIAMHYCHVRINLIADVLLRSIVRSFVTLGSVLGIMNEPSKDTDFGSLVETITLLILAGYTSVVVMVPRKRVLLKWKQFKRLKRCLKRLRLCLVQPPRFRIRFCW